MLTECVEKMQNKTLFINFMKCFYLLLNICLYFESFYT